MYGRGGDSAAVPPPASALPWAAPSYATPLRNGTVAFRIVGALPEDTRRDPALGPLLSVCQHDAGRGESKDSATAVAADSPLLLVDSAELTMLGVTGFFDSAVLLYGPTWTPPRCGRRDRG
ncbi:hypothetical protein [Streptomyces sp. IBSBF 2435]|uniref:hypothetical protein n=1 Tax=Streptomyces sp. IBSBF 2435 TaxID=2903531 RepID=UPI002FDBC916